LIICGDTELDGHVFCLGVRQWSRDNKQAAPPILDLMQRAVFHAGQISSIHGRLTLALYDFTELLERFQLHEASKFHDKVFALMGMSSDDASMADLQPNYLIEWHVLVRRLVHFLTRFPCISSYPKRSRNCYRCLQRVDSWESHVYTETPG
jgi:hypothetical protein